MIDVLKKVVKILKEKSYYADLIYIGIDNLVIEKDQSGINVQRKADKGLKMRVFDGEHFHEYGTNNLDEKYLLKKAKELVNSIELKKEKIKIDDNKVKKKIKSKFRDIKFEKKINDISRIYNKIRNYSDKIINARVVYRETNETRIFVSKNKELEQKIRGSQFVILPMVNSAEGVRYAYESLFKDKYNVKDIEKRIISVCKTAIRLINAKKIKPGKYTTILSPGISGLLAHESFGHGMECDTIYKNRAKAKEFFGKRIASKQVSIIDNPVIYQHGHLSFDDEGQLATKTYMIKQGIIKDSLTDMYSALREGCKRSANGRCESFDHKTYSRMTNTYFDKGKHSFKEMLKSVKNGILLYSGGGGMEDPKGWGVQIQGMIGERIKDGNLTGELYYEVGLTGYLPEILKNIQMVGNKLIIEGTGFCGKGHKEWVRVSEGGPYLKIKNLELA